MTFTDVAKNQMLKLPLFGLGYDCFQLRVLALDAKYALPVNERGGHSHPELFGFLEDALRTNNAAHFNLLVARVGNGLERLGFIFFELVANGPKLETHRFEVL